jgi:hypothetical protein
LRIWSRADLDAVSFAGVTPVASVSKSPPSRAFFGSRVARVGTKHGVLETIMETPAFATQSGLHYDTSAATLLGLHRAEQMGSSPRLKVRFDEGGLLASAVGKAIHD